MASIPLDSLNLPAVDVLALAQSGVLIRAERQTAADGIPAFVTQEGWRELCAHHAAGAEAGHSSSFVLSALERATSHLFGHMARSFSETGEVAPLVSLDSDLFPSEGTVIIAFVRDRTHRVICAVIGTKVHLATALKHESQTPAF